MANYSDVSEERNTSDYIESPIKILNKIVVIQIGIDICVENILAITVLLRITQLIYQDIIFSISLAITDCFAGFVICIWNCFMKKHFTAPFINMSLITVTLFNIDRCCSLKFALRCYQIVTLKVLKYAYHSWSWFCLRTWFVLSVSLSGNI
jgi:hypothetical protein